jgi:hypothetical protein
VRDGDCAMAVRHDNANREAELREQNRKCFEITTIHIYRDASRKSTPARHQQKALVQNLQLASTAKQLCAGPTDRQLASFLDLSLESNCVSGLPHLGNQGLAWKHNARKANLDVLERTELLQHVLTRDTEAAKTVENRCGETASLTEVGVDVKRVQVT